MSMKVVLAAASLALLSSSSPNQCQAQSIFFKSNSRSKRMSYAERMKAGIHDSRVVEEEEVLF